MPFDIDKLAELLMDDKRANPSNYAMVTVSEGATARRQDEMVLTGEADAYGHRKLGGIGEQTGAAAQGASPARRSSYQTARVPDALGQPRLARPDGRHQLRGHGGRPGARGAHAAAWSRCAAAPTPNVPIAATREGVKRVDVDELYDVDEYRPKVRQVAGKPMFLY